MKVTAIARDTDRPFCPSVCLSNAGTLLKRLLWIVKNLPQSGIGASHWAQLARVTKFRL